MIDLDELLPAIAGGDATAFARWLAVAEPPLRDSLRSFASRADVEAVLQESLLRVWQVAPKHTPDGRPNSLFRLAVRVARNLAVDEARRCRLAPLPDDAVEGMLDEAMTATFEGPDPFLRRVIQECRDELPRKPAEALTVRIQNAGAEPDRSLAERLGMTLNTFLQNFTRARKLLSDCLSRKRVDVQAEMA